MKKLFAFLFVINLVFLRNIIFAAQIPITAPTTGNYQVSDATGSNYLSISGNGSVSGNITNANSTPGHVDIVTNKDYNTGNLGTNFGTSSSSLGYILVSGTSTSLTITNNFYSNSVFLENSTLNLNSGDINISNISIHNGEAAKQAGSTININTNYSGDTTFGINPTSLEKNLSIEKLNINGGNTLTLKNEAFVNNINLTTNNSKLVIDNNNAKVYGTITGSGKVEIGGAQVVNYNDSSTQFGTEPNHIGNLTIKDGSSLTIEAVDGSTNNAYVDDLRIGTASDTSSLTIGKNGYLHGTISGPGTLKITSSYANGTNTVFGTLGANGYLRDLVIANEINPLETITLNLNNEAYIKTIIIKDSNLLNLNSNSKVNGVIIGSGTVNINTNYDNSDNKTTFGGTNTNELNINITENNSLSLSNVANLNIISLENNSSLNLNENSAILGTIQGNSGNFGTVNLNRNYNTSDTTSSDYFNTIFGSEGNSINILNINSTNNFTLGNLAYINNLNLNNISSLLNFNENGGVVGSITGQGTVNINVDYNTLNKDGNNGNNTNFGSNGNSLNNVNIVNNVELALGNSAYINNLNMDNNSTLTLTDNANIAGTIYGNGTNTTINVNTIFNDFGLGDTNKTIFGTSTNRITSLNINENGSLSLSGNSYINTVNINSSSSIGSPSLAIKANGGSATLNTENGIRYDNSANFAVLMSLKNTTGANNKFMEQIYNLTKFLNNDNLDPNLLVEDNNLYLNLLSRGEIPTGTKFFIDKNNDINYFDGASLSYETIFKDLKFETELNSSGETELYLVVKQDRTPTLNDVSQATLTAANVIDSWTFLKRSNEENTMISNLQSIESREEFFHALTNLTPDVSGANTKIPQQSMTSAINNIHKRLTYFRMLKFNSITNNYNFKNAPINEIKYYDDYFVKPYFENNSWIEILTGNFEQSKVDKIFGYDADYYGITLGYDLRPSTNSVFGISYTFNSIDANNKDNIRSDKDNLKVLTNNVDLYAMLYNKFHYLSFSIGGGYNIYNSERKINFSNFNKTAKADYNGMSYYGGIEYGFNITLFGLKNINEDNINIKNLKNSKKINDRNAGLAKKTIGPIQNYIMLTPKVSLTYNNIKINKFTEKGADAANLIIKTEDYSSLDVNAGLDLTFSKGLSKNTSFQTMLKTGISYALQKDKVELTARYIDDDTEFKVYGFEPDDLSYNLGINFSFNFYDKIDIGLSYDYTLADNFNGNLIRLTFLYAF